MPFFASGPDEIVGGTKPCGFGGRGQGRYPPAMAFRFPDPASLSSRLAPVRHRLLRWRIRFARLILLPELSPDDARELRHQVQDDGALTRGYMLMCGLAAGIAALGLLQSSTAVVIGAMLVSPLMSPIAALGFGFASIDGQRIRDAARVVLVGAAIGIAAGMLITWISPIRNATPELLARTQPTLLDLAVALLSGIAGGYATVMRKGGTAIGVAIATALMPPLTTVGYGIATLQPTFALGALLLFLTNLSAIAFAFALVARLSGAARPLQNVQWTTAHTLAGIVAFLALATPLAMTLAQVKREGTLRSSARNAIEQVSGQRGASIAQMDVHWPLFGDPSINAVVIAPQYAANGEQRVHDLLAPKVGPAVSVNLQQVLAADLPAQTRAMIDAAMERTAAGIAADVPPYARIRASIGLPTTTLWINRTERAVNIQPVAAAGWKLTDYLRAERIATDAAEGWSVRVIPPATPELRIALTTEGAPADAIPAGVAIWALQRWGVAHVRIAMPEDAHDDALPNALAGAGITTQPMPDKVAPAGTAILEIFAPPPFSGGQ